jgi:choline dehydrogenase-like flavoprotein
VRCEVLVVGAGPAGADLARQLASRAVDVLLVDRAVTPRSGHVVVAVIDSEFVCKTLSMRAGRVNLRATKPGFPDIVPTDSTAGEMTDVEIRCSVGSSIAVVPLTIPLLASRGRN